MADVQKYLDLITSEHKTQPKFIAWLTDALNKVDDAVTASKQINSSFDIDEAIGVQLDIIGDIVGRGRVVDFQPSDGSSPMLDDDNFRLVLKAKISQNQWDGTLPQVQELWKTIFPDLYLIMLDNQNMSMDVTVVGIASQLEKDLVANGYIVPKPQGVNANYVFTQDYIFAYDLYNAVYRGYDEGYWLQLTPIFSYDYNTGLLKGYDEGEWT